MTTAEDILNTVRSVYMNDPNGTTYTDTVLLPHLRNAVAFLETALESNGVQCKNSEVVKPILAGIDEYFPLPVDLVIPRVMFERQLGSSDEFRPITFRSNIPQLAAGPMLEYWTWRLDRIFFLAATTDREVRLYYQRAFPAVNTVDAAMFGKAEQYLEAKTAALALLFISQSPTLAEQADSIAENELTEIVNNQVKILQTEVTRRKGYLPFRSH